jgi:hypothetical protein
MQNATYEMKVWSDYKMLLSKESFYYVYMGTTSAGSSKQLGKRKKQQPGEKQESVCC